MSKKLKKNKNPKLSSRMEDLTREDLDLWVSRKSAASKKVSKLIFKIATLSEKLLNAQNKLDAVFEDEYYPLLAQMEVRSMG